MQNTVEKLTFCNPLSEPIAERYLLILWHWGLRDGLPILYHSLFADIYAEVSHCKNARIIVIFLNKNSEEK